MAYVNTVISLPQVIAHPDYDLLAIIFLITFGLCAFIFFIGWAIIGKLLHATHSQKTSLMFSLGMSTNGIGLVLGSLMLTNYPSAILVIVFYNFAQQIMTGGMNRVLF
ncbi:hypothetical protein NURINAE_01196 [Candidatus Nitrosacidococcus sp. I8]|nr:hypothetical protein NURINAE_01196 [Candidatus Nitrosacidococcus sp. I8]